MKCFDLFDSLISSSEIFHLFDHFILWIVLRDVSMLGYLIDFMIFYDFFIYTLRFFNLFIFKRHQVLQSHIYLILSNNQNSFSIILSHTELYIIIQRNAEEYRVVQRQSHRESSQLYFVIYRQIQSDIVIYSHTL